MEGGFESVSDELLNLWEDVTVEVEVNVRLRGADHFREVLEAHLVAILEFSIVLGLLLDSVVGQVDEHVRHVVEGVLATAGPYVAILVAVAFQAAVDAREQAEAAEVKLALVHQQGVVNVLLDDESPVSFFAHWAPYNLLDFAQSLDHSDTLATIRILAWLDDPRVLRDTELALDLLDGLLVVGVDLALVFFILVLDAGLFSLFRSFLLLFVILLDGALACALGVLDFELERVVIILKFPEFSVVHAVLRVERQRQHLEWILAQRFIVFAHVHKHALLVGQLLVLLQLVVEAQWERDLVELALGVGGLERLVLALAGHLGLRLGLFSYFLFIFVDLFAVWAICFSQLLF